MLGGSKQLFLYDALLENCYIGTSEDKNCIVLVYQDSNSKLFAKFENALISFRNFLKAYDLKDYIVFIFRVPPSHRKDFTRFLKGQYSRMSTDYKLQVLDFHDQDIEDRLGGILFKSEERRERMEYALNAKIDESSELYSIPTLKEEIYNINKKNIYYEHNFKEST
tara:strand:- start:839 stop:1336 length:498 start_codon:yes stop_codon:yes gene_type:complete